MVRSHVHVAPKSEVIGFLYCKSSAISSLPVWKYIFLCVSELWWQLLWSALFLLIGPSKSLLRPHMSCVHTILLFNSKGCLNSSWSTCIKTLVSAMLKRSIWKSSPSGVIGSLQYQSPRVSSFYCQVQVKINQEKILNKGITMFCWHESQSDRHLCFSFTPAQSALSSVWVGIENEKKTVSH